MSEGKFTPEQQRATNDAFNLALGRSVAAWSFGESMLCTVFERLTKMHPLVARKVFYSLTGFDLRKRMLKAVINVVRTEPDITEFLTSIVNKMGQYQSTRNMIVHGDVLYVGAKESKYFRQTILLQGRQPWTPNVPDSEILTIGQLQIAEENFGRLSAIISIGLDWTQNPVGESPLRFLPLIAALPNPAHSGRLDQKIEAQFQFVAELDQVKVWR